MQCRDHTIECISPMALAVMIDEYAIFGPKLGDRLPSFFGVPLSEHLAEIAFEEGVYGSGMGLSHTLVEYKDFPVFATVVVTMEERTASL